MRILILGAGIVGTTPEQLSQEKHDIYVIGQSRVDPSTQRQHNIFAMRISHLQDSFERVGVQDMDLVIAVTSSDEVNIVGCLLAHQYGVPKLVARVRALSLPAPTRLGKDNVGVDEFINPTRIVVDTIERLIEVPGCTDVAYIGGDICRSVVLR